jgi:hypothetical protein
MTLLIISCRKTRKSRKLSQVVATRKPAKDSKLTASN